jgi:hypothetical protein
MIIYVVINCYLEEPLMKKLGSALLLAATIAVAGAAAPASAATLSSAPPIVQPQTIFPIIF